MGHTNPRMAQAHYLTLAGMDHHEEYARVFGYRLGGYEEAREKLSACAGKKRARSENSDSASEPEFEPSDDDEV